VNSRIILVWLRFLSKIHAILAIDRKIVNKIEKYGS
jgi:hypothetical protein